MGLIIFQQIVGFTGIVILLILLIRALLTKLFRRYPSFYSYLSYVFLSSIMAIFFFSRATRQAYWNFYLVSECIGIILGLAVTLEVFRKAFASYAGVTKFANYLISILIVIALARLVVGGLPPQSSTLIMLDRDLRTVQALMLVTFAGLVLYYSIPIGNNLLGIALGYGTFVSTSVLNLMMGSQLGSAFHSAWSLLQPVEYLICELIWCALLWSPVSARCDDLVQESTYEAISYRTELLFGRLRAHLMERGAKG